MGVPPVKETGVERSPMSNLALRPHGRDAHAPLFCVAELGTSFDGVWRGLAGCR
jgi:hypothetical protein